MADNARGWLFDDTPDDKLYRVCLDPNTNTIKVLCIGMDSVDSGVDGVYASSDDLPEWLQKRLAVLMVTDWRPVTVGGEGIGRRIDENTYWIVRD